MDEDACGRKDRAGINPAYDTGQKYNSRHTAGRSYFAIARQHLFRRFLLAWKKLGYQESCDSVVVNYADDLVICCRPGKGDSALQAMTEVMQRIGLTVNQQKTRVVHVPGGSFDFLGYTIGWFYGKGGKPYIGTCPARKSILRLLEEIHAQTTSQWNASEPETRVAVLNQAIRGWAGYFDQGPVLRAYQYIDSVLKVPQKRRSW